MYDAPFCPQNTLFVILSLFPLFPLYSSFPTPPSLTLSSSFPTSLYLTFSSIHFLLTLPYRERMRTHSIESSGKLKISTENACDFTAEDLRDLGEIGRGAYGSVNKMQHKPSGQIMAVKVTTLAALILTD